MNPFFAYLIKSSISLAVLYSLFRFVMRNDKNHTLNRFLLLAILLISAIIPFLNIQFFYEEVALKQVEVIREFVSAPVFFEAGSQEIIQPVNEVSNFSINPWLALYVLITVALLFRIVFGVIKVTQIIKRAEKRRLQKIVLAVVKDLIQPFTFLNKVVISEKDFTENKDIIVAHEHAHIKHLHALDLMVCEVFTLVHFFNPFMWLLRRDLKLIHEYQADQAVLNKGIDAKKYQLLVLQKSVGERRFAMANHFTQKPILKRIKMMQQKNRKRWAALKLILFLPLLVILLQAFARPELIRNTEDFIPVKYSENKTEQWLSRWTADKIGKGFYEPELDDIDAPRKGNNVLVILMNARDEYLIENQYPADKSVKQIVKDYLHGINPDGKNGPDYEVKEIPFVGKMKVIKGTILYQHDLASSKEKVNQTIRSIGEACLEVRKEKAQLFFGKDYFELDEERQEAVNLTVPVWFSMGEPKTTKPPPPPPPINITMKGDGSILVRNNKYDSFPEFQEKLSEWNNNVVNINKKHGTNYSYRVNISIEKGVTDDEVEEIRDALFFANVNASNISYHNIGMIDELYIPKGFSPNNDGIHDYFIIKGIYPKYPDAKLLVFSEDGEKLFEKEHYGNTKVWGKDKVWWSGSSNNKSVLESDGKLPVGKYNYVLELGNSEKKSGTLLLAKSPPPKVINEKWHFSNLNNVGKVTTKKGFNGDLEFEKSEAISNQDILWILMTGDDRMIANNEVLNESDLDRVIVNFSNGQLPNGKKVQTFIAEELPYFGEVSIPYGVISFRIDINTSYVAVQEAVERIQKTFLQIRNDKSLSQFNLPYFSLDTEKRKTIDRLVPIRITTGEPKRDNNSESIVFIK